MKQIAKILLFNKSNQLLLLKRSDTHPYFPLHWDFPGGIVEEGEDTAVAVVRELMEEAGIKIEVSKVNLVYEKQLAGNKTYLIYVANIDSENRAVELSWEHSEFEWLTPAEFVELPIPPGVDNYYETVLRYVKSVLKFQS